MRVYPPTPSNLAALVGLLFPTFVGSLYHFCRFIASSLCPFVFPLMKRAVKMYILFDVCIFFFFFKQGVEPFNFSSSGSVWVQISVQFRLRFRLIETLLFGFAPLKNISKPVYKVPAQVRSKKWYNSCNTI